MQLKTSKTEPWRESGNGLLCPKAMQQKLHKLRTQLKKLTLDPFVDAFNWGSVRLLFIFFNYVKVTN